MEMNTEILCQLTGKTLTPSSALSYNISDETYYVDPNAVLELVQNSNLFGIVLERIALNQTTFNEILSIRKQAVALEKGKQEGAKLALEALRESAKDAGLHALSLEYLIKKTFNKTEEPEMQEVEDKTTEAEVQEV